MNTTDIAIDIRTLSTGELAARVPEMGALLHAVVHAGASVNFVLPYSEREAEAFWTGKVLPALRGGTRVLFVACDGARIAGSVQLDHDTPPNQRHRAEVTKLLVHPHYRRRGIARALMAALERRAAVLGRTLITLDTRTGDHAEPLYSSLGYQAAGVIPGYSLAPSGERLEATTFMYKHLRA